MSHDAGQTYPGFPSRVQRVPVPAPLVGSLLEQIDDLAELKCTLRVVALLNQKRGHPRLVTLREIRADQSLARAIPADGDQTTSDQIEQALGRAARRGTLAFALVGAGANRQPIFGLNTESDRAALAKIADAASPREAADPTPADPVVARPNIFALYEQNIGLLSPMIADQLVEAEEMYPESWIEDAIKEAVTLNRRSWRYVSRILERWEREGIGHGESGRHLKKAARF